MLEKMLKSEDLNVLDKAIGGAAGYAAGFYILTEFGFFRPFRFRNDFGEKTKPGKPGMIVLATVAGAKIGKYCAEECHKFRCGVVQKYLK